MARVEIAVRALLLARPEIAAAVGDRIHPEIIPEGEAYPAITYSIEEVPDMVLAGPSGILEVDLELTIWARSTPTRSGYGIARDLAIDVRQALLGSPGIIEGVDLMSITGGELEMGAPDTTTHTWQAWVHVHVIARPV